MRSFTVTNTSPPQPSLTTPASGAVLGALTPTLTWQTVTDADGDTVKYWAKVATGADGASGQVVSSGWLTAPASGPIDDSVADEARTRQIARLRARGTGKLKDTAVH